MPDADTVWLAPLDEILGYLERAGLVVGWQEDWSRSHRAVADSLIDAFSADAANIAAQIGPAALDELLAAHRLWSDWLRDGRVRKLAFVAEKPGQADGLRPRARRARRRSSRSARTQCRDSSATPRAPPWRTHASRPARHNDPNTRRRRRRPRPVVAPTVYTARRRRCRRRRRGSERASHRDARRDGSRGARHRCPPAPGPARSARESHSRRPAAGVARRAPGSPAADAPSTEAGRRPRGVAPGSSQSC